MALKKSSVLVSDSEEFGIEDASCCYPVLDELLNLNVFAVIDALQPMDLLLVRPQMHSLLLLKVIDVCLVI